MSKPATHDALEALTVTRLWALQLEFQARLERALARSNLGLTSAGFRLVGELMNAPEGLRQRELAQRLGVTAPTVSVAISRLEASGVVQRIDDERDPRAWRVRLARGAPIGAGLDVLEALDHEVFGGLSKKDRRVFSRLLDRLTAHLRKDPP
jgi:DNA-binding MarR family transcriptional regulator